MVWYVMVCCGLSHVRTADLKCRVSCHGNRSSGVLVTIKSKGGYEVSLSRNSGHV